MHFFGISIYTKQNGLSPFKGLIVEQQTVFQPISMKSGIVRLAEAITIGKGDIKERINFLNSEDKSYHLAIQILNPEEQEKVEKQGHAGWSWLRRFFWKPVKIMEENGTVIVILINIQSAVKRLNLLGFTAIEVKALLDKEGLKGNFVEKIKIECQAKRRIEIEKHVTKTLLRSSIPTELQVIGKTLLSEWIERGQISQEEIEESFQAIQDIKIQGEKDFIKLKEYATFKQATLSSFQDKEDVYAFLSLFNQISAIQHKLHISLEKAIQKTWDKINIFSVMNKIPFSKACLIHQKNNEEESY